MAHRQGVLCALENRATRSRRGVPVLNKTLEIPGRNVNGAVDSVLRFIPKDARVWTGMDEGIAAHLKERGVNAFASPDGMSVTEWKPKDDEYDLLLVQEYPDGRGETVGLMYGLGKPFACLCPMATMDAPDNRRIFAERGIEMFVPNAQPKAMTPMTWAFFCKDFLPYELMFERTDEVTQEPCAEVTQEPTTEVTQEPSPKLVTVFSVPDVQHADDTPQHDTMRQGELF